MVNIVCSSSKRFQFKKALKKTLFMIFLRDEVHEILEHLPY